MDQFDKMIKDFVRQEKTSAQQLEDLKREQARIQKEIAEREKQLEEAKKEREIVIRYIPSEPGSVKVVKGAEFIEPDKPDNVVALLEAAAFLMAEKDGLNGYLIMEQLLKAMINTMDAQIFVKELLAK